LIQAAMTSQSTIIPRRPLVTSCSTLARESGGVVLDVSEIYNLTIDGTYDGTYPLALGASIPGTAHHTYVRVDSDGIIPGVGVRLRAAMV